MGEKPSFSARNTARTFGLFCNFVPPNLPAVELQLGARTALAQAMQLCA